MIYHKKVSQSKSKNCKTHMDTAQFRMDYILVAWVAAHMTGTVCSGQPHMAQACLGRTQDMAKQTVLVLVVAAVGQNQGSAEMGSHLLEALEINNTMYIMR